ncbi:hypothetical protein LX16_0765 [Stackebrandtia albiflava]|uniref:Uncharacterized protein n=1 Tax=Stackebrandtia albiflava TaxID=406432 RepID=A0A562VB85_9ACTN|nr:hypothetical protein [Stackebrandtia albiflava]TWJ15067.1 hypothetical protein LX16_0765 [Stackebrandtia albiflava]
MTTPEELDTRHTLLTAVARFEELRTRDSLAPRPDETASPGDPEPLTASEALDLLALGETIARKAGYGRQLSVRTARAAGASWSEIGAALGTSKQAAWESHSRWLDEQAAAYRRDGDPRESPADPGPDAAPR